MKKIYYPRCPDCSSEVKVVLRFVNIWGRKVTKFRCLKCKHYFISHNVIRCCE